ncbi:matrix-remodeling-associated protein 8-like isoform X2 [Sinocyclocheilus rhinocerous]|uniref:matrix-remodeling-associated protein 8-like isoform X2 n=1 Tax=Sinocyclocheilus rhinocerous TaxID=307959 RepID=UPI0007B9C993|nr:PREDICTED: matrix-remodeling-associated protein 8-like isoform X2 [Sinocyclocheilus rhinocerous]
MKNSAVSLCARALFLAQLLASFLFSPALGQSDGSGVVVAMYNISAPKGSQAVLQCHSQRMVWTQDRLKDRQRVAHWDLLRSGPNHAMERVIDMFSAGDQRIYNGYNQGRINMPKTAFKDGNFSLVIKDVAVSDKGIYSCNLHHHYCHLYESIKVQLNVTRSARKERRFWDGQKAVYVVLVGSKVVLPCVNRRPIWTESNSQEDQQQVVHWDRQPPGVRHDRADRLIDLYASGERRHYGPLFVQQKMNISATAFSQGDFSLTISDIQPLDQGLYSCHLHHHYCGLHERRIFQLTVMPPVPQIPQEPSDEPQYLPNEDPNTNMVEVPPHVINVILPEQRNHFLQQLGYILATLLLLALIVLAIVLLTRQRKRQGLDFDPRKVESPPLPTVTYVGHTSCVKKECERRIADVKSSNQEETKLEYKNNLLKEAEMSKLCSPKAIDLDREMEKPSWK